MNVTMVVYFFIMVAINHLVGNSSWGCQVISGGGFINANGTYITGKEFTGVNPSSNIKGSGNAQGAYNSFMAQIRDAVTSSGVNKINYSLVNENKIDQNIFYNKYRKAMGLH